MNGDRIRPVPPIAVGAAWRSRSRWNCEHPVSYARIDEHPVSYDRIDQDIYTMSAAGSGRWTTSRCTLGRRSQSIHSWQEIC